MARHAVIDSKTLSVINVVEWDPRDKWSPPIGTFVVQDDWCNIDDLYDPSSKKFIHFTAVVGASNDNP